MSSPNDNPFPEEPLHLSGEDGFGFFPAHLGLLLNDSRYEVLRKLGRGQYSTTWLASDSQEEGGRKYCAIKILSVFGTKGHHDGCLLELEVMQTITASAKTPTLPRLYDHFETDGPHGRHLCLVLPVLSETISSFRRSAPSKRLDPPKVKIIIAQIVEALEQLHAANIIHTDLKPDNVLFSKQTDTETLTTLLAQSPQIVDGEFGFDEEDVHYPIMRSQPIPHPFHWDDPDTIVESYTVCLTDLGSAQWLDKEPATRNITPYALRAPEVILRADYGTKVDVWSLGCIVFELLTGRWLFHPVPGENWLLEDDHLAKIIELAGDTFSEEVLARCKKRNDYFDENGKLLRVGQLFPMTLEQAMINYGLPEADAAPAAAFIRTCLRLNPEERSTAKDLLDHPWLNRAH